MSSFKANRIAIPGTRDGTSIKALTNDLAPSSFPSKLWPRFAGDRSHEDKTKISCSDIKFKKFVFFINFFT
eukprot:g35203.t1